VKAIDASVSYGVGLRDIRRLRDQALPGSQASRDLASRLVERHCVEVGEADRRALCDQLFDQGATNSSRRARYHGDFPVESPECHVCPSARRYRPRYSTPRPVNPPLAC
jgi:hypothetical protein